MVQFYCIAQSEKMFGEIKVREGFFKFFISGKKFTGNKKGQATHIAPLQPPILAVFLPWGGSAGAGRVRPAGCKCRTLK